MLRTSKCVLSILTCAIAFCAVPSDAQSQGSAPKVVLEATNTIHGMFGHQDKHLLVRLTDDGKVEWDKAVGNGWEHQTSSVSADQLSEIEHVLNSIDESLIRGKLGPYNIYVDTSVELRIRMASGQKEVTFLVTNPWGSDLPSTTNRKPMPEIVKTIVCQIDRLHAQVSNTPVQQMCKVTTPPH